MLTVSLRRALRPACALIFALLAVSFGFADDFASDDQQLRADSDSANSTAYIRPAPPSKPRRTADAQFIGMSVLAMGLTIADIERTQHCLGNGTCRELNPLMPHSRAGMYAVNLPINALAMYISYRLKAGGHKTWWIAPLVVSGAHGVGVGVTF